MSGIFGFINLDGRPASPESFEKMADEMAGWGPDGVGRNLSGSAGFGHALLIVTHESPYEKMPYHDSDTDVLFTAAARLDNRDELCDLFGIAHPERPTTPDGRLVWLAYKKWGSDSCKHIFGDWSFAAWHAKDKRLFMARDHLGNTGLYYYFKPPLVVFASNVKAILAHPEVPCVLDEIRLARQLGIAVNDNIPNRTSWEDIRHLNASHVATVAEKNIKIDQFWRIENVPEVRFPSDNDYVECFLEHFRRAVRVRLNSIRPIGTTLSAGLDSSSVTALAAQELKKENRPLVAYTSVPLYPCQHLYPGYITDEWPFAHQVADLFENIKHIAIRAEDITPLTAIKRSLDITHTPRYGASNMVWIISLFEHAQNRSVGAMLTGQLGNGGVSWSGGRDYIFYLFVHKRFQSGWQTLHAWKKRHGHSWFHAVKSQLLRPILLPVLSAYQNYAHRQANTLNYFTHEKFIKQMGSYANDRFYNHTKSRDPLIERMMTLIRNGTMVGPTWHTFGTFYNMEVRDPTADVRLIEYCIGVPDEQDTFEGGKRMLIRRAMVGILPDAVRFNTIRGIQAADILARLAHDREELERELDVIELAFEVGQYLNIKVMKNYLNKIFQQKRTVSVHGLLRAINIGCFLVSFSKGKNTVTNKKRLDIVL